MAGFTERLASAKAAARPSKDVTVVLDADVSARLAELRVELEAARATPDARLAAETEPEKVQAQIDELLALTADALITLRFTRMSGEKWAEITARCPIRAGATIDLQYGYDMHAVCKIAAPLCGVRVEGDEEFPLVYAKASPGVEAVNEWADLFETVSGHEFSLIVDAIYMLNEYEPAVRVDALKKELANRPA